MVLTTAERRAQIVAVAVRLVGKHGIERTTVGQIAAEVGLSDMGPYRHFESKNEIMRAAYLYLIQRSLDWLHCSSHPSVPQRLLEIGEAHLRMLSADVEMYNAPMMHFITTVPANGILDGEEADQINQVIGFIAGIVNEGKAQKSIREDVDPVQFAWELIAWAQGEDTHYLVSTRAGVFARDAHLRMLELMIRDASANT